MDEVAQLTRGMLTQVVQTTMASREAGRGAMMPFTDSAER
jgi:hypothetical protein